MKKIETVEALNTLIDSLKGQGSSIGFVPTMGYLHAGHLSLIEAARRENDIVVVSIFVNPTQFGPNEDFDAYPRDLDRDCGLLESSQVDYVFLPTKEALYPQGYVTYVTVEGDITQQLCGASRPGHFKGVTTIVAKLFNLVRPDRAYFGQKDAQQLAVIRRMVQDLNSPVSIIGCPIVREPDGLALSSRNVYLSQSQRQEALALSQSLALAQKMVADGERDSQSIIDTMSARLQRAEGCRVDYLSVVDAKTLLPIDGLKGTVLIALAVYFGKTRLIDNALVEVRDVCQSI